MDNVQIFDAVVRKIEVKLGKIINIESTTLLKDAKKAFDMLKKTIGATTEKLLKSVMDILIDVKAILHQNTLASKLPKDKLDIKCKNDSHKKIVKDKMCHTLRHECTICEKTFPRKLELDMHIKTVHLKIKDLNCHICSFVTGDRSALDKHIVSKHPDYTRYSCNICGFSVYRIVHLKNHYYSVHNVNLGRDQRILDKMNPFERNASSLKKNDCIPLNNETHLCFQCGNVYTDLAELNNHMNENHQEAVQNNLS